jgi:hypothetical protein
MGIVNAGALDIYDQVCTNLCLCLCLCLSIWLSIWLSHLQSLIVTLGLVDLDPCRVAEID